MYFLANENFPLTSVRLMRDAGHDVAAVIQESPGTTDREVLSRAHQENRVLLTFDRDYGELIYRLGLPSPLGVVYLRFDPSTPEEPGEYLLNLLRSKNILLPGMFTVAEHGRVRQRPLP